MVGAMTPRRPASTAALAVVLVLVGNVVAWQHEARVRHVVCAEHGEALHAPTLAGGKAAPIGSRYIAVEDEGGEHHDCASARFSRASSRIASEAPATAANFAIATEASVAYVPRRFASDIIAIAPKTSPPA